MNNYSEKTFLLANIISKNVLLVVILIMLIIIMTGGRAGHLFLVIVQIILGIYLSIPGLALFRTPWISQAWLSALNPWFIPKTPWNELPTKIKVLIFVNSIVFFLTSVAILYPLFQKLL